MSSPAKLTDTQRAILFEASQRKDRCLIPPKTLKAAAAQKVATKLLKAGLVREIKAKTGMEAWRRDERKRAKRIRPAAELAPAVPGRAIARTRTSVGRSGA